MSFLKDKRCYLSGPIQYDTSKENWRITPKKILVEEFGMNLFDPFDDPKQKFTDALYKAQKERDFDTVVKICRGFVRKDLSYVDRSDLLIAYLPCNVKTTGTIHEIIVANDAKKPTLLVTDSDNIADIPLWFWGFIPKECMFAGWKSLYNHLNQVNEGKYKHNNRWDFIYDMI